VLKRDLNRNKEYIVDDEDHAIAVIPVTRNPHIADYICIRSLNQRAMEKLELKYVTELVKKVVEFLNGAEKKAVVRDTIMSSFNYSNGIARTPADSPVLRVNAQPWS
jgi:hypothetical protein